MNPCAVELNDEEWNMLKVFGVELSRMDDELMDMMNQSEECQAKIDHFERRVARDWINEEVKNSFHTALEAVRVTYQNIEESKRVTFGGIYTLHGIVAPALRKCYLYGVLVAYQHHQFIQAVDLTTAVLDDTVEFNYFDLAERNGIIAESLAERYKQFFKIDNITPEAMQTKVARSFAESEGLKTRYVTDRLKWYKRGLPCNPIAEVTNG